MANLDISRAERLDQHVANFFPQISRAFASKLISDGLVKVNGEIQVKPGYKLKPTDRIEVDYLPEAELPMPDIELTVLYEDEDCVVIDKPIGLLAHSKGGYNPEPTVASWLRSRVKDLGGNRAGIVHRLDRATSGVMICAKNPEALSWLQKQFSQRKVKKTYLAVVAGTLNPAEAVIDMPIERNPKAPATFRVGSGGKMAVTHYKTLSVSADNQHSLVELKPETGRTHQLRVHMKHLGHPILGDEFYDGLSADRLYLHAHQLELTVLKDHTRLVFESPLPETFNRKMTN